MHACNDPSMTDSFTCPRCRRISHNRFDAAEGYCGNCHDFTGDTSAALLRLVTANAPLTELRESLLVRVQAGATRDELRDALMDVRALRIVEDLSQELVLEGLDIVEGWCSADLQLPFADPPPSLHHHHGPGQHLDGR